MGHTVPMDFRRYAAQLLAVSAALLMGCGDSAPAAITTSIVEVSSSGDNETVDITASTLASTSTDETPSTTEPVTTTTEPPTSETVVTAVPQSGLSLVAEVDRKVSLSTVIVADSDGNLLGTLLDPDGLGCEASPISYFVTVGADGTISSTSTNGESFQYAGLVTPSPNQRQLLEVDNCEGFLGAVTLYDIDPALELTNAVKIDTRNALAGDAAWNADGFITLMLSNQPGFYTDPLEEDEVPVAPQIDEYLVNPRNGESTQSGNVDEFNYGSIRIGNGRSVHVQYGTDPGVVLTSRSGDTHRFSATGFAVSPDASRMVIWDPIYDSIDDGEISLVDLESGAETLIAGGLGYSVVWRDDSTRLAYSIGSETVVLDLTTGESLSVGEMEPLNCGDDDFVDWGRVPLAFAPNGDLYVGDAVCGRSSEGMPTVEYRLRQITLN